MINAVNSVFSAARISGVLIVLALATSQFALSNAPAETVAKTLTWDEVLHGLESTATAIQSYSVTAHCKKKTVRISSMMSGDYEYVPRTASMKYWVDRAGRIRCEATRTTQDGQASRSRKFIMVFDGQNVQTMEGSEKLGFHAGDILTRREQAFFHGTDPLNFVTHLRYQPASEYLKKEDFGIARRSSWEGRSVVVLESEPYMNRGREWKKQVMVDPRRNFIIVRVAQLFRFPPDGGWTEYSRLEMYDHIQDASGLWLPTRVVEEGYSVPTRRGTSPGLISRSEFTLSDWVINPTIPESKFELNFPGGVLVDDKVTGRTFKTAKITDQQLADQAAYAKTAEPKADNGFLSPTAFRWISAATAILLIAVVGCYWFLYRRSP